MRIFALVLLAALVVPQKPVPGEEKKSMATAAQSGPEVLIQKGAYRPQPIIVQARPVEDGLAEARADAAPSNTAYEYPWGSAAQNGRLAGKLSNTTLRQRWKTELSANVKPAHVLAARDRLLVFGGGFWELLDSVGKRIAEGSYGSAKPSLNAAYGLFYVAARTGYLEARNLTDGQLRFQEILPHSERHLRPLIVQQGDEVIIVSQEPPSLSPRAEPPNLVSVQVQRLYTPLEVDSGGMGRLAGLEMLQIKTGTIAAAVARGAIFAAVPTRLFLVASDLSVRAAYQADFEPLMMSVDEGGYIYLIVQSLGAQQLWALSPDGRRFATINLDAEHADPVQPPVIGYDHRIYSVNPYHVLAVNPDGATAFDAIMPSRIAGAGITTDGRLVASAADEVIALDANGKRQVLEKIQGETLRTPPVMLPDGELVVAGEHHLYSLGH